MYCFAGFAAVFRHGALLANDVEAQLHSFCLTPNRVILTHLLRLSINI
jgi:hypothetical protein